ncbi:putative bifunctional diguanylate cyclase/phosphodiesterase [Aquabacterium sp.]|uniref:putative bifunctional diguanylate cyclase/phosphodiesterase n=1 Tax=Aquabacterium sp. TaxID=1872578 RepID=UPI003783ECBE
MTASSLIQLLVTWWRREFHVYTALDRDSAEVRARHLQTVTRLTPLMVGANLLNATALLVAFRDVAATPFTLLWLGLLLAWCGLGLRAWWRGRRRPVQRVSPGGIHRATLGAAALAGVWASVAVAWFPGATHDQQLLLSALVLGMMCGGAFALAAVPLAAMAYVGVLSVGAQWVLMLVDGPVIGFMQGLLVVYGVILVSSTLASARVATARLQSEREAGRQRQLVSLLLRDFEEHSADVLWAIGPTGLLTHVSPRLSSALGGSARSLQATGLIDALQRRKAGADAESHLAALRQALDKGQAFRDRVVPVKTSSGLRWWSFAGKPVLDEAGHHAGWRGVISDVTQVRETHRRLAYLAHFDSLTGLANRLELRERLARMIEVQPGQPERRTALMCLDVDHFKAINDTLGHAAGDAVLAEVGRRLQACLRQDDLAARLGGDEFALVIRDVQDDAELEALARRVVQVMCQPCEVAGRQVGLGTSIGIAVAPDHGSTLDELMGNADLALYAAKDAGRGRFELFVPRLGDRHRRHVAIEQALRGAVHRDEMHLHWQPRVDVAGWCIAGAEVLLRWQHPELGRIAPDEFIPVAEESGLIVEIGSWVLQRACAHAAQLPLPLGVSVNVSPAQLLREDFALVVRRALEHAGLPADRLEVEVTESLFMDASPLALANLHALREMGVRIALDDFGTGYSSLAYLRRFPFDTLKIDRAFVRELMTRHDARAIVKTILELAQTLGMSTIAEGVEEPAQLALLREAGCDAIQGFMVARPMPRGDFLRLLANWVDKPISTPGLLDTGRRAA